MLRHITSFLRFEISKPSPRRPAFDSTRWLLGIVCAGWGLPVACAHGVDLSLEGFPGGTSAGAAGGPVNAGTGMTTTVGGGNGGARPATSSTDGMGGSSGIGGSSGAGGGAGVSGSGGSAGAASGSTGAGGSLGGGGVDVGSDAGGAGGVGGADVTDAGGDGSDGRTPRPAAITLSAMDVTTGQQMSQTRTGMNFSGRCAANEAVIGFSGTVEPADAATNWLRSFRAICGSLTTTMNQPYAVTTTQTNMLPVRGAPQSVAQTRLCPTNQVVVGFIAKSGGWIDQIRPSCAPFVIGGTSPSYTLTLGPSTPLPDYVGGPNGDVTVPFQCPAGQVIVGDEGRASAAIEAFGMRCARPSLVIE